MNDFLPWIFSWVCSQNPGHTWAPAGELLPMCQRCTGFYAGAAIAFVLMLWFRPRPNSHYRRIHTVLVLAMTPFGFHMVEHGAVIRTLSGAWFGFGVIGLLWLLPGRRFAAVTGRSFLRKGLHPALGALSIVLLPVFASRGGAIAAEVLPWLSLIGLATLAGLLLINLAFFASWLFSLVIRRMVRQTR